jgi:protein O-GlcNAc transferase
MEVEISSPLALESGIVTFGCLNSSSKVNEQTLSLWARVLGKVKDSRMLIRSPMGSCRERTIESLDRKGVEASRVEFVGVRPRREYLDLYNRMHVVQDTFPYNGHTTSLDALWMGAPVVSLAGATPVSRAGLSQLTNLGLPELVAHSETEYVHIAQRLAGDPARLRELRSTLRARMKHSVLMDAPRFARQIEQVYREIWRAWCNAQLPTANDVIQ